MQKQFITSSSAQTKKLGMFLAEELHGGPPRLAKTASRRREAGEIICLTGDLGAGKTTFTQGLLRGLGIKGAITSPTFAILKHYKMPTKDVYHIDAYRIASRDMLELGWKDFAGKPNTIVIIEWAERIKKIIPTSAVWINFEWIGDKERKIIMQA